MMHILTTSYGRGSLIIRNLSSFSVADVLKLADAGSANVILEH